MEDRKFKKGTNVVYGTNGICIIEDIKPMRFVAGQKESLYYILKPCSSISSTVFVPADNEVLVSKMREPLSKKEIDELLLGIRDKDFEWNSDRRFRNDMYHDILSKGVDRDLILMIRCIYLKKQELQEEGKKLPTTDNNTLKAAEKLLEEEFTYVLGVDSEEMKEYIRDMTKATKE
ncbi:MAG: hypothetical protein GX663_02995 [Clostridiales bacterium]|nr:hypothetical protein [Clostridiales bacterium]